MSPKGGSALRGRALSQVWRAFRQLNPKNVDAEASRPVRVGVVGEAGQLEAVSRALVGESPESYERAKGVLVLLTLPLDPAAYQILPRCDVVLHSSQFADCIPGVATERVFQFESTDDIPGVVVRVLREPSLDYAHLPLARALPGFRSQVAAETTQNVSIENAVFVASTALGNVIPNPLQPLASVAESLGDLIVLTANQMRMLFRLAAAYDQPLSFRHQAPQIATVGGAAFGWRAIARELVSKIPLGGGVIPKAAIAFAGTWALGDALAYYYATGNRLSKEQFKARFDEAYQHGKSVVEEIVGKIRANRGRRWRGKGRGATRKSE